MILAGLRANDRLWDAPARDSVVAIAAAQSLGLDAEYRPEARERSGLGLILEIIAGQVFSSVVALEMRMPGAVRRLATVPWVADAAMYRRAAQECSAE